VAAVDPVLLRLCNLQGTFWNCPVQACAAARRLFYTKPAGNGKTERRVFIYSRLQASDQNQIAELLVTIITK
jgi:hypothetical protein